MSEMDIFLVEDMVDYAEQAISQIASMSFEEYLENRVISLACERCVGIVGEAAKKISAETKENFPDVQWQKSIGMRHIMVHGYGKIQQTVVFETIRFDFPHLIEQLKSILNEIDPERTK